MAAPGHAAYDTDARGSLAPAASATPRYERPQHKRQQTQEKPDAEPPAALHSSIWSKLRAQPRDVVQMRCEKKMSNIGQGLGLTCAISVRCDIYFALFDMATNNDATELRSAIRMSMLRELLPRAMGAAARRSLADDDADAQGVIDAALVAAEVVGRRVCASTDAQLDRLLVAPPPPPDLEIGPELRLGLEPGNAHHHVVVRASDVPAIAGVDRFRSAEDVLAQYLRRPPRQNARNQRCGAEGALEAARRVSHELGRSSDRDLVEAVLRAVDFVDRASSVDGIRAAMEAFDARAPMADSVSAEAVETLVRRRFGRVYQERAASEYLRMRPHMRERDRLVVRAGSGGGAAWIVRGEADLLLEEGDSAAPPMVVEIKTRTSVMPERPHAADMMQLAAYVYAAGAARGELLEVLPRGSPHETTTRVTALEWPHAEWGAAEAALGAFARAWIAMRADADAADAFLAATAADRRRLYQRATAM